MTSSQGARLDGKVALITGGARGQGAAEAALFAAHGARVVITDVLDAEGADTADRLGDAVAYLHHDVSQEQGWIDVVDHVLAQHGTIDVLVNNAGIFRVQSLADTSVEDWHTMIAINQTGVFLGLRIVGEQMRANGGGSIINVSSIAGLRGAAIAFAYSASKWAVRGMTKSAALELSPSGVRVNSIHPGIIDTPMASEFGDLLPQLVERIPIGRLGTADDVASLALFLASDDSSFCSGHEFVVDGAQTAR